MAQAVAVEHIDANEAVPPGLYVTRSPDQAFGVLSALVAAGDAELVGEGYDPDGAKRITVQVGSDRAMRPNVMGTIGIGREFFTTALKDYEDWEEKWWREAIQNAVDAKATEITCMAAQQEDGNWLVSCEDDGGGMSEDVLINKFLVLGGTTKVVGGTTGGFGKAKELLVLPWLTWEVHTRDRVVSGSGIQYDVKPASYLHGTRITVLMPPDMRTTESAALACIGKCYLPGTRFTVNGQQAKAKLKPGELIREFGKANLYYDKKPAPFKSNMLVRAHGLYMFSRYVSDVILGQVILELTAPSIEVLTANRDGLRDRELRYQIDNYVNTLAADTSSALKKKKGLIQQKFEGSGKFSANQSSELRAAMLEKLGSMEPRGKKVGAQQALLSEEQQGDLVNVFMQIEGHFGAPSESTTGVPTFRVEAAAMTEMLQGVAVTGAQHMENIVKQLSWEPDFFLVNEVEDWHVPKKFYPETMTPTIRKLARFWAEMCRFVLMQLNCGKPYGVGWIFDADRIAEYRIDDEGSSWLMLNPFKNVNPRSDDAELYSLSEWQDVMELYASAVHEATHMADGITYHDESFASAFTRNVARTSGKEKFIRQILKIVAKAEREQRAKEKQKREEVEGWAREAGGRVERRGNTGGIPKSIGERMPNEVFDRVRRLGENFDEIRSEDTRWTESIGNVEISIEVNQNLPTRPLLVEYYESGEGWKRWDNASDGNELARAVAEVWGRFNGLG